MPIVATPNLDFTDKDFDSLRFRLRALIRSVFPDWTDLSVANFGNLLVELYAFTGDILYAYQDNQARQTRITTATQRRAMLGLARLIGYTPSSATAAQVQLTVTLSEPPAADVPIPAGSYATTDAVSEPTRYRTLADATIPAGANPPTVTVLAENSDEVLVSFSSSGLPNQVFTLARSPFVDGSAVIEAGNGAFTRVDSFLESTSTARHFTVDVDQNDRATVRFGNGVNGAIPVGTISVSYKIGGGEAGRLVADTLRRFESPIYDALGNQVAATLSHPASTGGDARESIEQIRVNAPAALRATTRSVSKEDFELHALEVPGIARALMLTSNEDPSVDENAGNLYVLPAAGGAPTELQKAQVLEMVTITYPCTLTFRVTVLDPSYKVLDVVAVLYFRAGANKTATRAAASAALTSFFAVLNSDGTPNELVDFGANVKDGAGNVRSEVAFSDVYNIVRDTVGVRKLGEFTLNGAASDVLLEPREFPQLGSVTFIDGETGQVV